MAPAAATAPLILANPLPTGRVTRSWGPAVDPFTGNQITHRGIDVAAPAGTSILAPADGVVAVATENYEPSAASGTVVVVRHAADTTTFYSHLGSLEVEVGQRVAPGDVLATVGSTGKSTGPHLHFEVHYRGGPENPSGFITAWQ